jgi:hypothetical protein
MGTAVNDFILKISISSPNGRQYTPLFGIGRKPKRSLSGGVLMVAD